MYVLVPNDLQTGYLRWHTSFPEQSDWYDNMLIHFIILAPIFQGHAVNMSRPYCAKYLIKEWEYKSLLEASKQVKLVNLCTN